MKQLKLISARINQFVLLLVLSIGAACKMSGEWLEAKSSNAVVTPETLEDYQAILDYSDRFNTNYPTIGNVGTDNFQALDRDLPLYYPYERNTYLFLPDIFGAETFVADWDYAYQMIELSNIVLDGIAKIGITSLNRHLHNNVAGGALFFRSLAFYNVAQIFCRPYSESDSKVSLGIPLRLDSDVNEKSTRSTVEQTYMRIVSDFKLAASLLPPISAFSTRPSRVCANFMIAKVYMDMGIFDSSERYVELALSEKGELLDFNSLKQGIQFPFPDFKSGRNRELLLFATGISYQTLQYPGYVDTLLYSTYEENDLRRSMFFRPLNNRYVFNGSYGNYGIFAGLATNELYLIKAEVAARKGDIANSMAALNHLLINRYRTGTFTPRAVPSADSALAMVISERRKELVYTGQSRWQDLRRLNKEVKFAKSVVRIYNGIEYILPPNDKRYVLPIPDYEIQFSNFEQNPR